MTDPRRLHGCDRWQTLRSPGTTSSTDRPGLGASSGQLWVKKSLMGTDPSTVRFSGRSMSNGGRTPFPSNRELGAKGSPGSRSILPTAVAGGPTGVSRPRRGAGTVLGRPCGGPRRPYPGLRRRAALCHRGDQAGAAPGHAGGGAVRAYALTESSSGSDAASLRTRAKKTEGGYAITGRKQFCTRGARPTTSWSWPAPAGTGRRGSRPLSSTGRPRGSGPPIASGRWPGARRRPGSWSSRTAASRMTGGSAARGRASRSDGALDAGRLGIAPAPSGSPRRRGDEAVGHVRPLRAAARRGEQGIEFMLADMATRIEAGGSSTSTPPA